jgi:uncharacterized protein with FMN-binding domain
MKRYPVVIGATIAGLAGVLTYNSHRGPLVGSGNSSSVNLQSPDHASKRTPAPEERTSPTTKTGESGSTTTSPTSVPATVAAPPTTVAPAAPPSTAPPTTTTTTAPPATTTTTAPPATTTTTAPPTTTTSGRSSGAQAASATGALEQYGYGQLSVRVTIAGGEITGVSLAAIQTAETYSQQLADQVTPILQREVLSAQSAQINGVSGATYTSDAYAASVQWALDQLRK